MLKQSITPTFVARSHGLGLKSILVGLTILLSLGACDVLDVPSDPQTVAGDEPVNFRSQFVGAKASLFWSIDSRIANQGELGDTFQNASTGCGIDCRVTEDLRDVESGSEKRNRAFGEPHYVQLQQASVTADRLQASIEEGAFESFDIPGGVNSPEFARVTVFEAYAKEGLASGFCSVAFDGTGPELDSQEVYALAEKEFTKAIEAANADESTVQAALVGRARARLAMEDDAGALADARRVNPDFEMLATYSTNTVEQQNRIYLHLWDFGDISVDKSLRGLTIDDTGEPDPRVELAIDPVPAFARQHTLYSPVKVRTPTTPLRIASGDEARYIVAELVGGSEAVDIINDIREERGIAEDWQPSGSGPDEIRNKVIDERRRSLFLEGGLRLYDLRRYKDRYGLDFFPTTNPQGAPMGSATCFPLPDVERNNNPDL